MERNKKVPYRNLENDNQIRNVMVHWFLSDEPPFTFSLTFIKKRHHHNNNQLVWPQVFERPRAFSQINLHQILRASSNIKKCCWLVFFLSQKINKKAFFHGKRSIKCFSSLTKVTLVNYLVIGYVSYTIKKFWLAIKLLVWDMTTNINGSYNILTHASLKKVMKNTMMYGLDLSFNKLKLLIIL